MTSRRFRLETVLRIRKVQEESARQTVLLRNQVLHARLETLAGDELRYRGLPTSAGPVSPATFLGERAAAHLAAASVERSAAEVVTGRVDLESAHSAWTESAMRVEALERLRTRHVDEMRVVDARTETATVDDLVTSRWVSPLTLASAGAGPSAPGTGAPTVGGRHP